MYRFVLLMLVLAASIQLLYPDKKMNKMIFVVLSAVLIALQAFRYDQGIDYWGYRAIYAAAPHKRGFPLYWYTCDIHGELGFKFLINLFTNFGLSATVFYGIFGTIIMGFILLSIKRYSPYENISLLLFYPTFFLTYVLSGVRQAMVAAVFLAFALKYLYKGKFGKYIVLSLVCANIHVMALSFLILIPIKRIQEKWILYCTPVAWVGGILFVVTPIHEWLGMLPGLGRLGTVEISFGGLIERTVMFCMISFLYWYGNRENDKISFLYKIYGVGYLVAIAGMVTAYGSQRLTMPLKTVEIILIPMLLSECNKEKIKRVSYGAVVVIAIIMTLKNLNYYNTNYNAFTYPYTSIWSKRTEEQLTAERNIVAIKMEYDEKYKVVSDGK